MNDETEDTRLDGYMPLCPDSAMTRHRDIFDNLRLELKIAADGHRELSELPAADICRNLYGMRGKRGKMYLPIYEAAAAVYCHDLYFSTIVPSSKYPSLPQGRCAELLKKSFGSAGNFFYLVRTLAAGASNPGFLWLYEKHPKGREPILGIARLPLYSLPDIRNVRPLMCIDLWEHAYIDRWNSDISGYADACLRQTDWEFVFSKL